MSKLNELLSKIISKLNASVKTEAQSFSEVEKAQARENIGATGVDEVGELVNEAVSKVAHVQPDYEQNDSDAADFIKNRTHWAEKNFVEIIPEMTIDLFAEGDDSITEWTAPSAEPPFTAGVTYLVTWNGFPYQCCAQFSEDVLFLGNSLLIGDVDNGVPFIIAYIFGEGIVAVYSVHGETTATISASVDEEVIHPIDIKYIDDMYGKIKTPCLGVPETTFTGSSYLFADPFYMTAGETYTIIFDGVIYELKATKSDDGYVSMGAVTDEGYLDTNSQIPFLIYGNGGAAVITNCNKDKTHVFSIVDYSYRLKTIDKQYLPELITDIEIGGAVVVDEIDHNGNPIEFGTVKLPAYNRTRTLLFDGNINDREIVEYNNDLFIKLSDEKPERNFKLISASYRYNIDGSGGYSSRTLDHRSLKYEDIRGMAVAAGDSTDYFAIFVYQDISEQDLTLSEGIYILCGNNEKMYSRHEFVYQECHQIQDEFIPSTVPNIRAAESGQIISVKEVDENGVPVAWEAIEAITNKETVAIDSTLSVEGQAADAKAVGDAIAAITAGLPVVTVSDNGKFLRVVDGVWAAQTILNAEEVVF